MSPTTRSFSLGLLACILSVLACIWSRSIDAADAYRVQMKGLDEQVQEVKSDVLSIAAELNQLEEKLLYPSNTHLAVFVSLTPSDALRLDAMQVQIDGQPAAQYIYSFKELEALQMGGVQRIYTGNVATGSHEIAVSVTGKLKSGGDFTHTERFPFSKDIGPKLLGLTVAGPDTGKPAIELGEWR